MFKCIGIRTIEDEMIQISLFLIYMYTVKKENTRQNNKHYTVQIKYIFTRGILDVDGICTIVLNLINC